MATIGWTQADIDLLKAAVLSLASGSAAQMVSYSGPPTRSVTYHAIDLPAMRALLASMVVDVNAQAGGSSFRLAATRKGV